MLSRTAAMLVPAFGNLTITSDLPGRLATGSIIAPNHDSLADPAVTLAALHRMGIQPVVMAAAGLWRIPLLGFALERGGHIPVHRRSEHAARALDHALAALAEGRHVLIYGEGRLPSRRDAGTAAPESFRTGLARLARASGSPIVPLGHAGARRITSGGRTKQIAGVLSAPLRRPRLHVHMGLPVDLPHDIPAATERAHQAVTAAWRKAARALGASPASPPDHGACNTAVLR
ncbi:lysophospholipid acyltransferase family protein [Streptomyces agglomeratus]|uniref:lysophospholipid acyltransferase family protein n=1 Tax=Streptomyces agglomeratus TaxID=285458 RepID=UPI00099FCC65|nr:lysophospholipid acyltransferase family protein [Streptomyces agglomeratus]